MHVRYAYTRRNFIIKRFKKMYKMNEKINKKIMSLIRKLLKRLKEVTITGYFART